MSMNSASHFRQFQITEVLLCYLTALEKHIHLFNVVIKLVQGIFAFDERESGVLPELTQSGLVDACASDACVEALSQW